MAKVVIGTATVQPDGTVRHDFKPVEFDGQELARHKWRTSQTSGVRQRLFRTADRRYIVSVVEWTMKPREQTTYSLREIDETDLGEGGEFEDLGRAWRGETLDLDTALTLEEALRVVEKQKQQGAMMITDLSVRTDTTLIPGSLAEVGQAANRAARRHVFDDYRGRKAVNTLKRQDAALDQFGTFLAGLAGDPGDMSHNPEAWQGVTFGLVRAWQEWLLRQGYSIGTVNLRVSTVRVYAGLAFQAGTLSEREAALIQSIKGYDRNEARHKDGQREANGGPTRKGAKKAEPVFVTPEQVQALKALCDDSPQGRRDRVIVSLLADHGLRVGELVGLTVGDVDLSSGELSFYRPKVNKSQRHRLTTDALNALRAYLENDAPAIGPLLRASRKDGSLTHAGMSRQAIGARVKAMGEEIGVSGLSPHDLRHSWATQAARSGTPIDRLRQAGGWDSLSMPVLYVEDSEIANEGVILDNGQ